MFQNQQGKLSLAAALAASGGIVATGGTGPSDTGGPLSKGLSIGTNAESDEHNALCFLAAASIKGGRGVTWDWYYRSP